MRTTEEVVRTVLYTVLTVVAVVWLASIIWGMVVAGSMMSMWASVFSGSTSTTEVPATPVKVAPPDLLARCENLRAKMIHDDDESAADYGRHDYVSIVCDAKTRTAIVTYSPWLYKDTGMEWELSMMRGHDRERFRDIGWGFEPHPTATPKD
jgi:hypothetical protein